MDDKSLVDPPKVHSDSNNSNDKPPPSTPPSTPPIIQPQGNNTNSRTMDDLEFLNKISKLIRSEYDGEPDGLASFIDQIELVDLGTPQDKKLVLNEFIKSRLVGRAKDAVSATDLTVEQIKTALKSKIKPENSDVVLGRLMALKADRTSLQNFQEKGEELAEKLRKAYIFDGMPNDLARKMVVEQTVEMCKSSARSEYVKTVIASAAFEEPKDVLAKFVVEVTDTKEKKDATVLSISANRGRGGHGRGRGRGRQNNSNNGYYRRYNNNYNNNNNGNNGQFRRRDGRGRGRGGQHGGDHFVRFIEPGNGQPPAAEGGTLTLQQANQ